MTDSIPIAALEHIHTMLFFGGKWHIRRKGYWEYHKSDDLMTAIRMAVGDKIEPVVNDDCSDLF